MNKTKSVAIVISVLVCGALFLGAVTLAVVLVITKPKAEKKRPPKRVELVDVQPLKRTSEQVVLTLTGTVTPAKQVKLRARVNGEVVELSDGFVDGGLLSTSQDMLKIDPVDYELALTQAESSLEKARFDYKMELGRQDVAKREWELLKPEGKVSELEKELALRAPHLKATKAALQAAEANLQKAKLNLKRTTIKAPFNAVVLSRNVNLGSQASQQDVLAELAGTDVYWIMATVPVDRIEWLTIPGSRAKIYAGDRAEHEGRVIKLLGDLESKGRMARILIEVEDPMALKPEHEGKQPLLLGEYVKVKVEGSIMEKVISIPRSALREGDVLWTVSPSNTLAVNSVDVLWKDADRVLIGDVPGEPEQLIISDITAPISGMDVSSEKKKAKRDRESPSRKNKEAQKPKRP